MKRVTFYSVLGLWTISNLVLANEEVQSRVVPFGQSTREQVVLLNDTYVETGGQAYLQMGFIAGEKAGIWVEVPKAIPLFKIDFFRVLFGGQRGKLRLNVFFQMGLAPAGGYAPNIPREIENAATVTPGPYWNDIPATGARGGLRCAEGGELVGASVEFTHEGVPSVYRDLGPLKRKANTLYGIPGGWKYSAEYGLTGNWILRIVGHQATPEECK